MASRIGGFFILQKKRQSDICRKDLILFCGHLAVFVSSDFGGVIAKT